MTNENRSTTVWPGEFKVVADLTCPRIFFFDTIRAMAQEVPKALLDEVFHDYVGLYGVGEYAHAPWTQSPLGVLPGPAFDETLPVRRFQFQRCHELNILLERKLTPGIEKLLQRVWDWAAHFHLVSGTHLALDQAALCERVGSVRDQEAMDRLEQTIRDSAEWTFFLPFVWQTAVYTLDWWRLSPHARENLDWVRPGPLHEAQSLDQPGTGSRAAPPAVRTDAVQFYASFSDGWRPAHEKRAEARRRIHRRLDEWLDMTETGTLARGFEKAPRKMEVEHFDWLVFYQVQGKRYSQIATEAHKERQTIHDGVVSAATMVIGAGYKDWLLPGEPGRPLKTS